MTVLITLTTAGIDSGPFNLYTNIDGYTTPFETGVAKTSLTGGYISILVPDTATIIRVKSTGTCINYTDITLVSTTTTTTTLAVTSYGYVRDGSQNCAGFHIPYVVYLDAHNVTQTIYLDECTDTCTHFYASSIVSEHYVSTC